MSKVSPSPRTGPLAGSFDRRRDGHRGVSLASVLSGRHVVITVRHLAGATRRVAGGPAPVCKASWNDAIVPTIPDVQGAREPLVTAQATNTIPPDPLAGTLRA